MQLYHGAFKDVGPDRSCEGKEEMDNGDAGIGVGGKGDEDLTATGAIGIRSSAKRTVKSADLDKSIKAEPRSENVRRSGLFAGSVRYIPSLTIL